MIQQTQQTELQPCPFCGSSRITTHSSFIQCQDCNMGGPFIFKADFANYWNTRHTPPSDRLRKAAEMAVKDYERDNPILAQNPEYACPWYQEMKAALSTPPQKDAKLWCAMCCKYGDHQSGTCPELHPAKAFNPACGDCDPCIGGRPDQCALLPFKPLSESEVGKCPNCEHGLVRNDQSDQGWDDCPVCHTPEQPQGQVGATTLQKVREALELIQSGIMWRRDPDGNGQHYIDHTQIVRWNEAINQALSLISQPQPEAMKLASEAVTQTKLALDEALAIISGELSCDWADNYLTLFELNHKAEQAIALFEWK